MHVRPEDRLRRSLPARVGILAALASATVLAGVVGWRHTAAPLELRPLVDPAAPWVPWVELDHDAPHDEVLEQALATAALAAVPFGLLHAFSVAGDRIEFVDEGLTHLVPTNVPLVVVLAFANGSIVELDVAGEIVVDLDGVGPLSGELFLNLDSRETVSCSASGDQEPRPGATGGHDCTQFYPKGAIMIFGPRRGSCWSTIDACADSGVAVKVCSKEGSGCWANYLSDPPQGFELDCGHGKVVKTETGWCVVE